VGRQRILLVDDNQVLVALLARLLETEGLVPILALRGKAALEKIAQERPDAAVVDVLLPDMMGYEVAAALRKARVPFVFVTGVFKGAKAVSEAKAQHGAAGYFEKPFDAKKLVEALRGLLPATAEPQEKPKEEPVDFELDVAVEAEERVEPMELTGRVEVVESSGKVQAIIQGQPLQAAPVEPTPPPFVLGPPARTPAQSARPAAAAPTPLPRPGPPPAPTPERQAGPVPEGELRNNFPELITAFWLAQQTGELVLQKGKVRKVIYFEGGRPVFAASNMIADRFGPFLQRVGKITREQLDAASALDRPGQKVGEALLRLGYLREQEKIYYLAQQVKAIIYSLFGWEQGRYRLVSGGRPPQGATRIEVHPANLIVRGVKKLYKPDRLDRLLAPSDRLFPTQQPAYGLHEVVLEIWEAQLLPRVDGRLTVADLVRLSGKPPAEALAFLWALVALQILERGG
jgi:CheY-like chemotaxis protein